MTRPSEQICLPPCLCGGCIFGMHKIGRWCCSQRVLSASLTESDRRTCCGALSGRAAPFEYVLWSSHAWGYKECCGHHQLMSKMVCRFEDLLRAITVSRTDICNAMVFALDNAESATEVGSAFCGFHVLPDRVCQSSIWQVPQKTVHAIQSQRRPLHVMHALRFYRGPGGQLKPSSRAQAV